MNKKLKSLSFLVILGLVLSFLAVPGSMALADWDEGDDYKMHWPQLPDLVSGIDISSNDKWGQHIAIADDFLCTETGLITDIHVWSSWLSDNVTVDPKFDIYIFSDNSSGDYSKPDEELWHESFYPGDYTSRPYASVVDEPFYLPSEGNYVGTDNQVWQYNFFIDPEYACEQQAGTTYWLCIWECGCREEPATLWGWKTSTDNWTDYAVQASTWDIQSGNPEWLPVLDPSGAVMPIDMAFVITTSYDFGDAPEGAIAYPSTSTPGQFPTCLNAGPAGFISHASPSLSRLGYDRDVETDGNAGTCTFPPYDQDECCWTVSDDDSGLMVPQVYTINATNQVVPCPVCGGGDLGYPCMTASWGINLDLLACNFDEEEDAFVNVLMDWNQDGQWGGNITCPDGTVAPEHVLVNFPIPPSFDAPISFVDSVGPSGYLNPPNFEIGPCSGYVWSRFTITRDEIDFDPDLGWDGSGEFGEGETEDYLLFVSPEGEYGDAPEGAIAYPSTSTPGQFPTCLNVGPAGSFIFHSSINVAAFGNRIETESDGNAGTCTFPPYDQDECGYDDWFADAGLRITNPYTIDGSNNVVPCSGCNGTAWLGPACELATWGTNLDIKIWSFGYSQPTYVNVLMDWNHDGAWSGNYSCGGGIVAPEHVLVNFYVPSDYSGNLSDLLPPDFRIGPYSGYVWSRFTITPNPIDFDPTLGWDGSGSFECGETEDYLLKVVPPPTPSPPSPPPSYGGPVGITVMPMDRAGLLLPWLGLAGLMVLATGAGLFARRHLKR